MQVPGGGVSGTPQQVVAFCSNYGVLYYYQVPGTIPGPNVVATAEHISYRYLVLRDSEYVDKTATDYFYRKKIPDLFYVLPRCS
jgi:hypothetical protein